MSVQEAPTIEGQDVSAGVTQDGDPSQDTGGSPSESDIAAVGGDGDGTVNEGEEPSPEIERKEDEAEKPVEQKAPGVSAEEIEDMRSELAQARAFRDDVKEIVRSNPAVAKAFGYGGQESEGGSKDYKSKIDSAIDEAFAPADGKALKGALAPLFEELSDLRRQVGRADSTAGKAWQTAAQREFRQGLAEAKVPVDNPAFVKLQKELRRDPEFAAAESQGKPWALRATKDAWFAQAGAKAVAGNQRAKIQAAQGGRIGGRPSGNAATAEKVIRMPGPFDGEKALAMRLEAIKAGKPMPKFEWLDK